MAFLMDEEMGLTRLQQTLRSLCLQTEWKYAVFWKLKRRARMMLTWEDAYYNNHEPPDLSDHKSFNGGLKNLHDRNCLRDPLGLAVAKMSYLVYSLGEGIVGQVAVSGKHQWIFADTPASSFWSSSEFCDGWQTQFSAGIRTVAVVAVSPHGVLQLGSLNKVSEDMKLVTHIKNVFFSLHNSSSEFILNPTDDSMQSTLCSVSAKRSGPEILIDMPHGSDKSIVSLKADIPSHLSPGVSNELSYVVVSQPRADQKNAVDKSAELLQPEFRFVNLEDKKQINMKLPNKKGCVDENCGWRDVCVSSNYHDSPAHSYQPAKNNMVDNYFTPPLDKSTIDYPFSPMDLLTSVVWDSVEFDRITYLQNEELQLPVPFQMELGKGLEQSLDFQTDISCIDTVNSSRKFSACCELHEALGPAFKKEQARCAWSESDTQTETHIQAQEGMFISQFTRECRSEQLLEAIVASACSGSSNVKSEGSLCKSAESILTTGNSRKIPNNIKHGGYVAGGSVIHSSLLVEDGMHHHANLISESTETCTLRSPKESSSKILSTCSKQLDMQEEPAKTNRKRARPGESCRPRPRDRQLIQDRVKELRELVPNGSKCSIDSLLERTIKHMLFLQNVSKHADKLKSYAQSKLLSLHNGLGLVFADFSGKKCAEPCGVPREFALYFCAARLLTSPLGDKGMSLLGSCNHEHGSSWALEVGNQIKGCPIVVENLNLDGQMLVEMLCEDCDHFLQISEAIRRLDLTILKGATEAHGEKTWACFVVEDENNRRMHRMDILWSLMQLLQPTTSI